MLKLSNDMAQISHDLNIITHTLDAQAVPDKALDDLSERIERISRIIHNLDAKEAIKNIREATKAIAEISPEGMEEYSHLWMKRHSAFNELNENMDKLFSAIFATNGDLSELNRWILINFDKGDITAIKRLLAQNPVNLNAVRPHTGGPLLNLACKRGYLEMVKFLLSKGGDVNYYDKHSRHPLIEVILSDNDQHKREILNLLLEKGANLTQHDHRGYYLLVNLIENAKREAPPEKKSSMEKIIDSFRYIVEQGHMDITNQNFTDRLFAEAFLKNSPELVRLLVYSGAPLPDITKITWMQDYTHLLEAVEKASKRRDDEIAKITKKELKGMSEPDVLGLIGHYAGMESLTPEQRKQVIRRCLHKESIKDEG